MASSLASVEEVVCAGSAGRGRRDVSVSIAGGALSRGVDNHVSL